MIRLALGGVLAASLAMATSLAVADEARVGTAGPVIPHAMGIMPDGTSQPLQPGQDIVLHEKIVTDHDGQAEILFLDRSSLSIGPDTETAIDDFAYSPADGSGKLAANADKGLLRFSGGALSKHPDQVTVRTPVGILGVRGGIAIVEIDQAGGTTATFLYGNALTLTSLNGGTVTVNQPGYFSFIASNGAAPTAPHQADLTGKITVLFHGPAGTGATSREFEAALLAGVKALDDTNNAANLLANANFFKQIQGMALPPCPSSRHRSAGGACI